MPDHSSFSYAPMCMQFFLVCFFFLSCEIQSLLCSPCYLLTMCETLSTGCAGSRRIPGLMSPRLRTPSPTFPQSPSAMKTSMSSESSGISSRKSSSDNILLDGKTYEMVPLCFSQSVFILLFLIGFFFFIIILLHLLHYFWLSF